MVTVESFCGCRNGGASGEVVPPPPPAIALAATRQGAIAAPPPTVDDHRPRERWGKRGEVGREMVGIEEGEGD